MIVKMKRIFNILSRAFYRAINCFAKAKRRNEIANEQAVEEFLVTKNFSSDLRAMLSREEEISFKRLWEPVVCRVGGGGVGLSEIEMFKRLKGFDPRYLTHNIYLPIIARTINNYKWTKIFENKAITDRFSHGQLISPTVFARKIEGEWYGGSMEQLSFSDVCSLCSLKDLLIVKDAKDSSGGVSVERIDLTRVAAEKRVAFLNERLSARSRDVVIQECIKQHYTFARFNPTSLNTLRITTLYLNGRFTVCSIVLRMGQPGSTVDNWGAGGIMIGVYSDGKVYDVGYDIHAKEYRSSNGVFFQDATLEQIPGLLKAVEYAHVHDFSLCKFIGWDIAVDEHNNGVIIEINSSQPGVIGEQLCTGPIFGNRTQEVIDYCMSKPFVYNRAIARY